MSTATAPTAIPVIDLSAARRADGSFDPRFLDELRRAAHHVGFFHLVGHGVGREQEEELLSTVRELFALPQEQLDAASNLRSPHFRGYTAVGREYTRNRPDLREQIDFGPERPAPERIPPDEPWRVLDGPNLWPEAAPGARKAAMAWTEHLSDVGRELLAALSASLGLPEDHFAATFSGTPAWTGKLVHYVGGDREAGAQGVGAHADYGFLALLLQDEVGGLEVRPHGQQEWIPVDPLPGALVVNLGEMLEVATDGYLMATIHRVQPPAPGVDRYSVPFFWAPRLDARIERVALPEELARQARGVSQDAENPMLPLYGENALLGWLRAHPQVAARHHPHLVGAPARRES